MNIGKKIRTIPRKRVLIPANNTNTQFKLSSKGLAVSASPFVNYLKVCLNVVENRVVRCTTSNELHIYIPA